MNFTQDEIAAIIGAKELECIALRREVSRLQAEVVKAQDEILKHKEDKDGVRPQADG